jgi:hypothetical protein
MDHLADNLHVRPVPPANTAQDPHVLHVLLVDIKQRHLEQQLVPPVYLVPQDLPIRPAHVLLLRIGCVQPVLYVLQEHGEVPPVQSQQTQDALLVWRDPHSVQ